MDIKQKVIQRFNIQLGSNLKNLEGIYEFHECLQAEKNEIEKSVSTRIYIDRQNCNRILLILLLFCCSCQWHRALLPQR